MTTIAYNNFDSIQSTFQNGVPDSGGGWSYPSPVTNYSSTISIFGWKKWRLNMFFRLFNFRTIIIVTGLFAFVNDFSIASIYNNFDSIPATSQNGVPGSGGGWSYSSSVTKPSSGISTCGWIRSETYSANPTIFDFFNYYRNGYNNSHMGFETYGFMEIDNRTAVQGNSLRITVTGGMNNDGQWGIPLFNKESYLSILATGKNPISSSSKVGSPYLYFMNNSPSHAPVPFPHAHGANRLSFYLKLPDEVTNGPGGTGNPPRVTAGIGPYNGSGGHWYHFFYNHGGGWTHILADAHPQHNNSYSDASRYPYPSYSLRNLGIDYYNTMFRWYLSCGDYDGIATPSYSVWIDEIEFYYDSEPQNNETINSPSVTYHNDTKQFEIGFNDKYKNNGYSLSTYELRYSFSPITNSNWSNATPAKILADSRFAIGARSDGKFAKWWPYYQSVWAPFRLANSTDEEKLTVGVRVYFAIKDISQVEGNSKNPVRNCGIGNWKTCGRDYLNQGETFDYAGDQPVLNLIKRIDFIIPTDKITREQSSENRVLPAGPRGIGNQK